MIKTPDDSNQLYFTSRAELVADEPLVQTVDEIVNRLDLSQLYVLWSEKGRAFYDPAMMLKILFFSYSDGEHHSRDIVKKIKYDVRYQYFTGSLCPSHATICRFRTLDVELLASYFVEIVSICEELGLLDYSLLAIDGTKIKASASRRRTLRHKDIDILRKKYKEMLTTDILSDTEDYNTLEVEPISRKDLKSRIRKAMVHLELGENETNLTDLDARFMKTSDGGIRPSYNGQIAVDKNQFIIAVDIGNNADDKISFQSMIEQSQNNVNSTIGRVLVDGGYNSGRNLKYIRQNNLDVYMPMSKESSEKFQRKDFEYNKARDCYVCPVGAHLSYKCSRTRNGVSAKIYRCSSKICGQCSLKSKCTNGKKRELSISEVYKDTEQMKKKLKTEKGKIMYDYRKVLVEPVFGNMKYNLGFRQFVLRGLKKVKAEFLLMCIAHNLKKMSWQWNRIQPSITDKTVLYVRLCMLYSMLRTIISILSDKYTKSYPKFEYNL